MDLYDSGKTIAYENHIHDNEGTDSMASLKKVVIFIPFILFITIFLYGDLVPVNVMEARNFITAREMMQGGSWLLPTMNGELRIAKPPLPTWITAIFMQWAGTDANLIANRIPAGLAALLLALFTYLMVRRITGDMGIALTSLLLLTTSYMFMLSARKNAWDIFSIAFMAGAVWAMVEVFMRREGRSLYLLLFSLFLACSFYSKGPVPFWVMLVPFVISYMLIFGLKDLHENRWGLLLALILCAILSAAWPLYVYLNTPHAAAAVASRETAGWFTKHTEPLWYYLLHFQEIVGIWVFFLFYGLIAPFIKRNWKPGEKLFVLWFILTIVFISVFPEKKLRYLLPAVVPGAIVSAVSIRYLLEGSGFTRKTVYGAFCLVTGGAFLAAAGVLAYYSQGRMLPLTGVPILVCIGAVLIFWYLKNRMEHAHLVAVAGICMSLMFLPPVISGQLGQDEAAPFLHLRNVPEYQGMDFYSLGEFPPEVIWASGRMIKPLNDEDLTELIEKGSSFILMTDYVPAQLPEHSHMLESIRTKRKTYSIYGINEKYEGILKQDFIMLVKRASHEKKAAAQKLQLYYLSMDTTGLCQKIFPESSSLGAIETTTICTHLVSDALRRSGEFS